MTPERFVHVLLFQCPTCNSPIAAAQSSQAQNVEDVDAVKLKISCGCGWNGVSSAVHAKRHWVDSWDAT
jgi:hypothetical protein